MWEDGQFDLHLSKAKCWGQDGSTSWGILESQPPSVKSKGFNLLLWPVHLNPQGGATGPTVVPADTLQGALCAGGLRGGGRVRVVGNVYVGEGRCGQGSSQSRALTLPLGRVSYAICRFPCLKGGKQLFPIILEFLSPGSPGRGTCVPLPGGARQVGSRPSSPGTSAMITSFKTGHRPCPAGGPVCTL